MSKVSKALKGAYKKSGLRDIYEKNKQSILTAAAVAAAAGTGGLAAPALGGTLGTGVMLGGSLGYGLAKNKIDKAKQERTVRAAQQQKDAANTELGNLLDGVTGTNPQGTPGAVAGQPMAQPNVSPDALPPQLQPAPGEPIPVVTPADVTPSGGVIAGTGEAAADQNRLMAEAEQQKLMQLASAGQNKEERAKMLQDYAALISQQQNRILDENAPNIYEDLNTRGLLRSSELGNAFAKERGKSAAILQEQIGLQGLQDRETALGETSGINDQYYQGRYGAIQRGMSLEDFVRQTKAAQLTGQALAPLPQAAPSSKGGTAAMIGAGANVATAMKGK